VQPVHRPLAQRFCHFLLSNNERRLINSFDEMHFIKSAFQMKTVAALCTRASYQPLLAREFISHVKKVFSSAVKSNLLPVH
jgi:hypothetical protein